MILFLSFGLFKWTHSFKVNISIAMQYWTDGRTAFFLFRTYSVTQKLRNKLKSEIDLDNEWVTVKLADFQFYLKTFIILLYRIWPKLKLEMEINRNTWYCSFNYCKLWIQMTSAMQLVKKFLCTIKRFILLNLVCCLLNLILIILMLDQWAYIIQNFQ